MYRTIILFLLFYQSSQSQTESIIPQSHLTLPALIEIPIGTDTSYGSGFIMSSPKMNLYLVTAAHVLLDKGRLRGTSLFLTLPPDSANKQDIIRLDLACLLSMHALLPHKSADVLLIRIGIVTAPKKRELYCAFFITESDYLHAAAYQLLQSYQDVAIGNDVYMYGYPTSIGLRPNPQFDYKLPLLRKGIIAGKFKSKQTIITDCPSYQGNSGGPVIQASPFGLGLKFKIIGVVTEFIPFDESRVNRLPPGVLNTNSGYAVIESADRILEILKENE